MARGKSKARTKSKTATTLKVVVNHLNIEKKEIVPQCNGCGRVEENDGKKYCQKFADPAFHWEIEGEICSFATHVKREVKVAKKVLNPLKASKRAAGKKK